MFEEIASSISYSLYLLHLPVGQRVFGVFRRFPETPTMGYLAILSAMVFLLVVAYAFWLYIELPAQRWAHRSRRLGVTERPKDTSRERLKGYQL